MKLVQCQNRKKLHFSFSEHPNRSNSAQWSPRTIVSKFRFLIWSRLSRKLTQGGGKRAAIYSTLHRLYASEPIPLDLFLPSRSCLTRFNLIFWCFKIHVSKLGKYESLKKWKFQGFVESTFFSVFGSKNRLRHFFRSAKNRVFFDKFSGESATQIGNRLTGVQSVQGNIPHPPLSLVSR